MQSCLTTSRLFQRHNHRYLTQLCHGHLSYSTHPVSHHRHQSTSTSPNHAPTIAIIGSGPAGFYTARKLQRFLPQSPKIEIYDRLPVPFGLVRHGVAPDHPEVKNCQDEFSAVAASPSFTFIGNTTLGATLPLSLLTKHYNILIFAYGASQDRALGIPGEDGNVISARAFVGWYNGLPEYRDLKPDLSGEKAVVIGQGNVALDVARILLQKVEVLEKTDITEHALEVLRGSKVKDVRVVGRRGPVQAAFTIKEVREMLKLEGANFRGVEEGMFPEMKEMARPRRRMLELLKKGREWNNEAEKSWSLDFCLKPEEIVVEGGKVREVVARKMELEDVSDERSRVRDGEESVRLPVDVVFRSIGYRAEAIPGMEEIGAEFDEKTGTVKHDGFGRILPVGEGGLAIYCAGWVKRGPTGVIASTMTDAFETAEAIVEDWKKNSQHLEEKKGWEGVKNEAEAKGYDLSEIVHWTGWQNIDQAEKSAGHAKGKPREKIDSLREMIHVANSNAS